MKLVMKAAWGSRRLASSGVFRMLGLKWLSTSPIPFSWYSAEFQGSFRPHSSASMTSYCHSEPASSGSLAPRIGEGERCFGLRARNEGVLLRDPSNFASKQLVIKMVKLLENFRSKMAPREGELPHGVVSSSHEPRYRSLLRRGLMRIGN